MKMNYRAMLGSSNKITPIGQEFELLKNIIADWKVICYNTYEVIFVEAYKKRLFRYLS